MATITWLDKIDGSDLEDPQKNVNAADMNQIKTVVNTNDSNNTSAHSTLSSNTATVQTNLDTHISDATAAHAATAISNTAAGNISATTVQAAINELDTEKAATGSVTTVATDLSNHIADTTAAHAASAISNAAAGGIVATTVQAAINELDTEKAPIASPTFTTGITTPLVKITSGSPGVGKFLTSDADGDGSWANVAVESITGVLGIANGGNGTTNGISAETQAALNLKTAALNHAKRVTPSGAMNGINVTYTIGETIVSGSDEVFYNGQQLIEGVTYTISGSTITMTLPTPPASDDYIRVNYIRP